MNNGEGASTRARILDAAERLFSHQGLETASVRAIAAAARVNIAAVNYHFGSKEALERETFRLLAERANAVRLNRLDACIAAAGKAAPAVEDLVKALIAPYLAPPGGGRPSLLPQLILLLSQPGASPKSKHAVGTAFDEVARRFVEAFARALPDVPPAELWWRYELAIGAIVHAVGKSAAGKRIIRLSGGMVAPAEREQLSRHLVAFVSAGMRGEARPAALAHPRPRRQQKEAIR